VHFRQTKHHRWALDHAQVDQYHLGGALHPRIRWWETMGGAPRIPAVPSMSGKAIRRTTDGRVPVESGNEILNAWQIGD
jgi:hypothetical protein